MADFTDPNNWTKEYVRSHQRECLSHLKEDNLLVIRYVQQKKYTAAIAGLDRILNGLTTMQNSNCGNYWSFMSTFSMAEGILLTLLGPQGVPNAIKALKDAKDFARNPETKKNVDAMLSQLRAGKSLEAHPNDVVWLLQKMNPKLDDAISGSGTSPSRSVSSSSRSALPPVSGPVDSEFEAWVEDCDWDEEDLERYYKKIRFRRNLYGLCLLLGPLGVLILPFWMRAVHITKSIRCRSFSVKQSLLVFLVTMILGLPTLYIYPIIMGKIIVATNWGMGMGDRRAWIPIIATIVLVAGLLIRFNVIHLPFIGKPAAVSSPSENTDPAQVTKSPAESSGLPQTEPGNLSALSADEFEQILMGNWSNARREEGMIYIIYFGFPGEGEIHIWDHDYMNTAYFPNFESEDEYGWFTGPRGYATFSGNYSLTASGDGRFTLVVIGAYEYEQEQSERTYEFTYMDDDTILIDGETYVRGSYYTLMEFAEIFDFGLEVEEVVDTPLP